MFNITNKNQVSIKEKTHIATKSKVTKLLYETSNFVKCTTYLYIIGLSTVHQ